MIRDCERLNEMTLHLSGHNVRELLEHQEEKRSRIFCREIKSLGDETGLFSRYCCVTRVLFSEGVIIIFKCFIFQELK